MRVECEVATDEIEYAFAAFDRTLVCIIAAI
jgi:hypothetical protein